MKIKQALRLLRLKNEHQLAELLGINYQRIQYWRKAKGGEIPHPFPYMIKTEYALRLK